VLFSLSSTEFVEPPPQTKFLGTPLLWVVTSCYIGANVSEQSAASIFKIDPEGRDLNIFCRENSGLYLEGL